MAYFDVYLNQRPGRTLDLTLKKGRLSLAGRPFSSKVPAMWRGDMPLSGYSRITVSLWQNDNGRCRPIESLSSPPMVLKNGGDMPLEWLQVAVTDKCNLRCPMCTRQHGLDHSNRDIPDDVLEPLLEAAPGVVYLGLQGLGEPLMHRDLPGLVRAFRSRMPAYGRIAVTTNGTLLDRSRARDLIDAGINTFTFSVDGASKAVYESLRVGAEFERVVDNMKSTVACVKQTARDDLWVNANFAMGPDNLAEVPAFAELAASIQLSSVYFFHGRTYPDMQLVALDEPLLTRVIHDARRIARNDGLVVRFAYQEANPRQRCPFMSNAYMWITGEVTPCQRMEPPGEPWPTKILGNVRDRSLSSIWRSPDARKFRRAVLSGAYPPECRGCSFCDSVVC